MVTEAFIFMLIESFSFMVIRMEVWDIQHIIQIEVFVKVNDV